MVRSLIGWTGRSLLSRFWPWTSVSCLNSSSCGERIGGRFIHQIFNWLRYLAAAHRDRCPEEGPGDDLTARWRSQRTWIAIKVVCRFRYNVVEVQRFRNERMLVRMLHISQVFDDRIENGIVIDWNLPIEPWSRDFQNEGQVFELREWKLPTRPDRRNKRWHWRSCHTLSCSERDASPKRTWNTAQHQQQIQRDEQQRITICRRWCARFRHCRPVPSESEIVPKCKHRPIRLPKSTDADPSNRPVVSIWL